MSSLKDRSAATLRHLPFFVQAYIAWQMRWRRQRRKKQVAPPGDDWTVWLLLAGRGFGKTRTAAEWLGEQAYENPGTRWLVSARTTGDMRSTCFEGESGLVAVVPPELVISYNKTLFEMWIHTKDPKRPSLIKGISAEKPEAFRGPQFHGGWLDELSAWQYPAAAWDMIMFGMRLKSEKLDHPRIVVSTTPQPKPLIRQLASRAMSFAVAITVGTSMENFNNLATTYQKQLLQYEGTQLGRQEIYAEVLDSEENGIIKRSWLQLWPDALNLPVFEEIIVSLDTAFTEKTRNTDKRSPSYGEADPTACTVWGVFRRATGEVGIMLLECWDEHYGLPDLIKQVRTEMKTSYGGEDQIPLFTPLYGPKKPMGAGRPPDTLIIEDKGSGISLRQMLAQEDIFSIAYNPGKADKLARLHGVSHIFNQGFVYLPESKKSPGKPMSWANNMVAQLCSFTGEGSIDHDDYVDSTTQAIKYVANKYGMKVTLPPKKKKAEDERPRTPIQRNPYKGQ